MNKINLCMVDDDPIVRDTISEFINLQENFAVNHAFGSAEEFLAYEFSSLPQILLLDVGLPGLCGINALPLIKNKYIDLDIIMLTTYEEEDKILKALCNGASSYISKRAGLLSILEGIKVVANGGSYMSPQIAKEIANHFFKKSQFPDVELEGRQKEIMGLLVDGNTYQSIAELLNISVETVRSHIKKIYRKLHANNKAEAISIYLNSNT
ncbi:DNA-binding response regulator, NarL/FixJ family, contains REC and HTH domains [Spirosomataceae bacterium TFI 002]|nr:DNA-binding response regulator, NarL/FixJ family, contains REC and HTH domains [Spirosomataceae bacterium TFI 002]